MRHWLLILVTGMTATALAQPSHPLFGHQPETHYDQEQAEQPWQELEVEPPAFPRPENLQEFYVSAVATNKYLVDASTLSVAADGVVRYVLVVRTAGGATNVSFEGMNCREGRWKHYATGRNDGTWTKSRAARVEWQPIENKPVNRHHAALSRDMFCPVGSPIRTADEGRNALSLGKHPQSH